jgi:hypothetical protein
MTANLAASAFPQIRAHRRAAMPRDDEQHIAHDACAAAARRSRARAHPTIGGDRAAWNVDGTADTWPPRRTAGAQVLVGNHGGSFPYAHRGWCVSGI